MGTSRIEMFHIQLSLQRYAVCIYSCATHQLRCISGRDRDYLDPFTVRSTRPWEAVNRWRSESEVNIVLNKS
jgi:hypothetical protein